MPKQGILYNHLMDSRTICLNSYLAELAVPKYHPTKAGIRRQDLSAVFTSMYSASQIGVNVTLDYLIYSTESLYQHFGRYDELADLFVNVASHISREDEYNELKFFVDRHTDMYPATFKASLHSAVTIAETNLKWFKNNACKIWKWIINHKNKIVLQG
ncbi:PREDICTED: aminopeptidase N-like [Wasmannia auropunctata]|uniref:aminopeptidase N-like n=1 Tax=Wasmannia auropunctata TaxID=64793 RepID=UPI0005EFA2A1|nr:PREDICTED: aminopeptidase N-like [Wasmannia auropunctata]